MSVYTRLDDLKWNTDIEAAADLLVFCYRKLKFCAYILDIHYIGCHSTRMRVRAYINILFREGVTQDLRASRNASVFALRNII